MKILPTITDGTSFYDFDTQLEGTSYNLEFQWNERNNSWYCKLSTSDGTPLSSAVRVCVGWPLFNKPGLSLTPPGVIIPVDVDGTGIEAGLTDLGSRVLLMYIETTDP